MDSKYADWISRNVPDNGYGMCASVTERMVAAFPELIRVRGHYYCYSWGERAHWWCVTPDETIVDPTAAQFPSKGRGEYVPWDETVPEPTGMCMNCGGYCYGGDSFCSKACEMTVMADMGLTYH